MYVWYSYNTSFSSSLFVAFLGHQAVMYSFNGSDQIFMYGGLAYDNEHVLNYGVSYYTHVSDEMWYFQFEVCINNCSFHGDCYYGFCRVSDSAWPWESYWVYCVYFSSRRLFGSPIPAKIPPAEYSF